MHKKDYIQRQFEEFGKVLATILSLRKNKDWEKFEKDIAESSLKFTSLDLEKTEKQTIDDFKNQVTQPPALLYDQKKILANLFFEKMNAYHEKGEMDAYLIAKSKCLFLYEHLSSDLTQNEFDLEVHYRLNLLKQ